MLILTVVFQILLDFAFNTQTKELLNRVPTAEEKRFVEYQIITLTIAGRAKIPEPIMDNIDVLKVYNPNRLNDPKRYQPKYKMAYSLYGFTQMPFMITHHIQLLKAMGLLAPIILLLISLI